MKNLMAKRVHTLSSFYSSEDGAGTVTGLFFAILFMLIGGIAVDGSNLWRNRQLMQQTADAAAHSGAVQIALRNPDSDVHDASLAYVQANMPLATYGNLYANSSTDVKMVRYDSDTNTIVAGTPNAASVTLRRDDSSGNPLDTLILRLADVLTAGQQTHLSEWGLSVKSVATLLDSQRCESSDAMYSKGDLSMTAGHTYGPGYCVHSQSAVWMPSGNTFKENTGISMPDLAACKGKCDNSVNPGAGDAAFESNMIVADIGDHILNTASAFLSSSGISSVKDVFFDEKHLDSDLSALADIGIDTLNLQKGSVVELSLAEFHGLADLPEGLTYEVECTGNKALNFGSIPGNPEVHGIFTAGRAVTDVAIVTDCPLYFGQDSAITGSVIISTKTSNNNTITARQGAAVGTHGNSCNADAKTTIMGMGDVSVPSDFASSNVALVIDGDINFASGTGSSHSSLSLMSSQEIHMAANHTFNTCGDPSNGLIPALQVIRLVVPTNG